MRDGTCFIASCPGLGSQAGTGGCCREGKEGPLRGACLRMSPRSDGINGDCLKPCESTLVLGLVSCEMHRRTGLMKRPGPLLEEPSMPGIGVAGGCSSRSSQHVDITIAAGFHARGVHRCSTNGIGS